MYRLLLNRIQKKNQQHSSINDNNEESISSSISLIEYYKNIIDSMLIHIKPFNSTYRNDNNTNKVASEILSRLVFYNQQVRKNDNIEWEINIFIPYDNNIKSSSSLDIKIVIKDSRGKIKALLMDLKVSESQIVNEEKLLHFKGKYSNRFKTDSNIYFLVAESTNYSKKLFKIYCFSKEIPYELNFASCWDMFVNRSRDLHIEIENCTNNNEINILGKLLHNWNLIFSVAQIESRENLLNFIRIYEEQSNLFKDCKVLEQSPIFVMIYLIFNCEKIEKFKYLTILLPKFRKLMDSLVGLHNGTAVKEKTLEIVMNKIYDLKLLDNFNFDLAKENLLENNLNGELSKYLCLLEYNEEFIQFYYTLLECFKQHKDE